jgi:hypothetical protein
MKDDELQKLMQSLGASVFASRRDPRGTMAILISETVKFRDKLKQESGKTLTVGDTRAALDGLQKHLTGQPVPDDLSSEQQALLNIWIERLTGFQSD